MQDHVSTYFPPDKVTAEQVRQLVVKITKAVGDVDAVVGEMDMNAIRRGKSVSVKQVKKQTDMQIDIENVAKNKNYNIKD